MLAVSEAESTATAPIYLPSRGRPEPEPDRGNDLVRQARGFIVKAAGKRYEHVTLDSFKLLSDDHRKAVLQCREYVDTFRDRVKSGSGLIFVGPRGTGKDHLMIATLFELIETYPPRPGAGLRAVYRDTMGMLGELKASWSVHGESAAEHKLVNLLACPSILALSDPMPPAGALQPWEQRVVQKIIDSRYRQSLPIAATINVASRAELDERLGPLSADRLLERAVIVRCNWSSYRQRTEGI